ncbi:MAG: hypothetical protein ACLR1T_11020 [Evtepia gabavorous]
MGFVQIGEQAPCRLYGGLGLRRDLVQPAANCLSTRCRASARANRSSPACSTRQGSFPDRWSSSPLSRAPGRG